MNESKNLHTAETGEEYLNKKNFRSLVEWITAETLLTRPKDPLLFIRAIVDKQLGLRGEGVDYDPEHATTYIKNSYADASASADENGRISTRPDYSSETPHGGESFRKLDVLEKLIEASRTIAMELDPFEATKAIIQQTCHILAADRATLFTLDKKTNHLVIKVAEGAKDIRVPVGQGIAGTVASTGKAINIEDAYSDPRFDSHFDLQSGFKTKTILCIPVLNAEGAIVGVLQAINRKTGTFTKVDEEVMGILAGQAGIALTNAESHRVEVRSKAKVQSVLDIVRAMHSDLGINSLMFTITHRIQKFVDCDKVTLYIHDVAKNELWSVQSDVNIRIPATTGIAGAVAQSGKIINITDAYDDERFSQDYDKKSGYRTRTILALPLCGKERNVVGVLQLINKEEGPFTAEDEEILTSFLDIAGPIVEHSHLFTRTKPSDQEGNEFSGKSLQNNRSSSTDTQGPSIIEEEEEEEEEES